MPGKIDAPLGEKLQAVKWGEYRLGDLFDHIEQGRRLKKDDQKPGNIPFVMAGTTNNGVVGYISNPVASFPANSITVDIFGNTFYRDYSFGAGDDTGVYWNTSRQYTESQMLFLASMIKRYLQGKYDFGHKLRSSQSYDFKISLPTTSNNEIDFDFMESFIRELEEERIRELQSYLAVTGLSDYTLTKAEQDALVGFDALEWQEFRYDEIFNRIEQGRRLKKDDQIQGDIPFVMSGTTNTGVVNYISNPVASFPANSLTVDIFGNTFYRSFAYGLGDDTGAYWSDKKEYSKEQMLFFAASVGKSLAGKYSYGHKLRSSQSLGFKMLLPVRDGMPDYEAMQNFISAVQKLVIKDVVKYADKKIGATKAVVNG